MTTLPDFVATAAVTSSAADGFPPRQTIDVLEKFVSRFAQADHAAALRAARVGLRTIKPNSTGRRALFAHIDRRISRLTRQARQEPRGRSSMR